jgi:hypothetical protein
MVKLKVKCIMANLEMILAKLENSAKVIKLAFLVNITQIVDFTSTHSLQIKQRIVNYSTLNFIEIDHSLIKFVQIL